MFPICIFGYGNVHIYLLGCLVIYYMYGCFAYMYVNKPVRLCDIHEGQKRKSDLLGTGVAEGESYHVGAGN